MSVNLTIISPKFFSFLFLAFRYISKQTHGALPDPVLCTDIFPRSANSQSVTTWRRGAFRVLYNGVVMLY